MYWNVVEVRPERDYNLFVRFADGVSGVVRISPEEMTGVLAPLRDRQFFEKVFIDRGVVAWPGETRARTRCDVPPGREARSGAHVVHVRGRADMMKQLRKE